MQDCMFRSALVFVFNFDLNIVIIVHQLGLGF